MILKRKIYKSLENYFKLNEKSKAVLIEGARRIGKSTIALEFAKQNYESYVLIDFSTAEERIKNYFEVYANNLDTLFLLLSIEYKVTLIPRKTIFIFDEIQFCPKARQLIKHLVQDGRYDYIETGSLISIKDNVKNILIPSEEHKINMYPLDFEEFLWALGEESLCEYIKECFYNKTPLLKNFHNKALLLFKQYMIIGGMPQSVVAFLESNQFNDSEEAKREILNLYRNDIMKINTLYREKVLSIFDQIPGLLSQHEKRVVFNKIKGGDKHSVYEESFFWLNDSKICNQCFLCSDPSYMLALNENRTYIKCYFADTGLLFAQVLENNAADKNLLYKEIISGNIGINNGMFFENIIAQTLTANGYPLFFYTHYSEEKHRNDIEIDFLITNKSVLNYKIIPIEVKSSTKYQTKSLDRFLEKYKSRIDTAYIIHPRNLSIKDNGIVCIPSYMAFCL